MEDSGTLVGGVTGHLKHPFGGRTSGQTGESDSSRFQMNEEQEVVGGEPSPGKHLNRNEVGTCQDGEVGGDEIFPGGILAPFRCRLDPVSAKDIADGLVGNGETQIGQSFGYKVVSPSRVLSCEANNERLDLGRYARAAW